jgi:hypothetical protein
LRLSRGRTTGAPVEAAQEFIAEVRSGISTSATAAGLNLGDPPNDPGSDKDWDKLIEVGDEAIYDMTIQQRGTLADHPLWGLEVSIPSDAWGVAI